MLIALLLFVPLSAMALLLGMGRLEDTLLTAPASPAEDTAPLATGGAVR